MKKSCMIVLGMLCVAFTASPVFAALDNSVEVQVGNVSVTTKEIDCVYQIASVSLEEFGKPTPSRAGVRNQLISMKLVEPLFLTYSIELPDTLEMELENSFQRFFQQYEMVMATGSQEEKKHVKAIKDAIDRAITASGLSQDEYVSMAIDQAKYQYKQAALIEALHGDTALLEQKAMQPVNDGKVAITSPASRAIDFQFSLDAK